MPENHRLCPVCHVRVVMIRAPYCFSCASCASPNPDMEEVTRMIRGGRTEPRLTLAQLVDIERAKVIEPKEI